MLDSDKVHGMVEGMEPIEEAIRQTNTIRQTEHYRPRVEVPPDADAQTKLHAFLGRQP